MTETEKTEILKLAQAQIEATRAYQAARQAFFDAEKALGPNYVLAHGLAAERRVLAPYHAAYEALAPAMREADKALSEYLWALAAPAPASLQEAA